MTVDASAALVIPPFFLGEYECEPLDINKLFEKHASRHGDELPARFEELPFLTGSLASFAASQLHTDAEEAIDSLLILATTQPSNSTGTEDTGADAISNLGRLLQQIAKGLNGLAVADNKEAARELSQSLDWIVGELEMVAKQKLALFRPIAKKMGFFPARTSQNPEWSENNKDYAKLLDVGADSPIKSIPQGGRMWKLGVKNRIAVELLEYMLNVLELVKYDDYLVEIFAKSRVIRIPGPRPDWLVNASALPIFGPDTWEQWEEIAWQILEQGNHPAAASFANPRRHNPSPALLAADRRKALKRAFKTIATGES